MGHEIFQKLSSFILVCIGLVLIFWPRQWFPDFYHPLYMGVTALLSPLFIYFPSLAFIKNAFPKKGLILELRSVIALAILINVGGELGLFKLYKFGFEYDKFAHFLVCMLFTFIICELLAERKQFSILHLFGMAAAIVFGLGIFWEFVEIFSDIFFDTQEWGVYGKNTFSDTYRDMIFNIVGIISGSIAFWLSEMFEKET